MGEERKKKRERGLNEGGKIYGAEKTRGGKTWKAVEEKKVGKIADK